MKYYVLFFFVLFLCACTGDENSSSCSVSVQLLSPTDEVTLPFEEMEVVLTNKDQGTVYTSSCSSDGVALFNVEYGYYTVAVHYQSVSGIIFSGRLESLSLLPEQGEEVMKVQLQLARSKINALVIKEIYYVGCKGELGADYQADQYVTLYNNSDETVYLDGLCLALVDPMPGIVSGFGGSDAGYCVSLGEIYGYETDSRCCYDLAISG